MPHEDIASMRERLGRLEERSETQVKKLDAINEALEGLSEAIEHVRADVSAAKTWLRLGLVFWKFFLVPAAGLAGWMLNHFGIIKGN